MSDTKKKGESEQASKDKSKLLPDFDLDPASTIKRIGGYLHRVVPVLDQAGNIMSYAVHPMMVELKPRDIAQIAVGSMLLALPVCLTEEAWMLAGELPRRNLAGIVALSVSMVGVFIYFQFYRFQLREHWFEFIKRVVATYVISAFMVGLLLTLFEKMPWEADSELAVRRLILITLPASFSATLTDSLK